MDGDSPECRAWRLFGEILFWMFRQKQIDGGSPAGMERLWSQLDRPTGLASADVLYQLDHSRWRLGVAMQSPVSELINSFPSEIGEILEQCIKNRESLTSLFQNGSGNRDGNIVRFLIRISPQVDTSTMITTLRQIADDPEFGKDAIDAIESIQRTAKTR